DPAYSFLFNSYYESQGAHLERARRGLLTRPALAEVMNYRRLITERALALMESADPLLSRVMEPVVRLGIHHEQQHQELLLTDMKHLLGTNPLRPAFSTRLKAPLVTEEFKLAFIPFSRGLKSIGAEETGFSFDHERPRNKVYLESYELASRLVSNGEYLEFIEAGGYRDPSLWLSDGWDRVRAEGWTAPLYWERTGAQWSVYTLGGLEALRAADPVCHVSYYEADAYARWKKCRLPTEAEWENACVTQGESDRAKGNFVEKGLLHPRAAQNAGEGRVGQFWGDAWEWTASAFLPYPGFTPLGGAFGEYNGKFMSNQMVLRGGSCATPESHIRSTYRNFFGPHCRWQFSSIRLARGPISQ
ncbi:MAG: ergothioneine biosynthesis protein EgtB, partial [Bdellovibrionota bacterium]